MISAMGPARGGRQTVGLVTPDRLVSELGGFQVVDARPALEFSEGHIPGATSFEWEWWCERAPERAGPIVLQPGYWGRLRDAPGNWYAGWLEEAGLRSDRPIVVYADGPRSRGREGRIGWMLLYLGVPDVLLLEGGWKRWQREAGTVEHGVPSPPRGFFSISVQPDRRQTLAQLRDAWRDGRMPALVDTRSLAEYVGERDTYLPRRGHLPGAALVPFDALFTEDGSYAGSEALLALLPTELRSAPSPVAYCEVGVRAALFAVLHEIHTGRVVPVYDGSFMEWALQPDLPVAQGPP